MNGQDQVWVLQTNLRVPTNILMFQLEGIPGKSASAPDFASLVSFPQFR